MKKLYSGFLLVSILMLIGIMTACSGSKEGVSGGGSQNLSLLTGGTGGTYYPLGGQIGNIISDNTKANITPQTSGASAENMETLRVGEAEIAFSQTDIGAYAIEGKEMFEGKPIDNIQAISSLYPETVQLVTTAKSGIKSVSDLKGKKVSVGAPGSGAYINAMQILEIHGLSDKDIKAQNLSFDESTDGIQAGNIDAAFITAGTPTGAVEALSVQNDIVIIPMEDDKVQALVDKYPYYAEDTIPSGTYKIKSDIKTVAVKAMLVVSKDLDEELVYEMTRAIYENTDKITHAKGKFITPETALEGLGDMELHPGAAKYFKEKGVTQ
ncbi:TAXI family TRAP transporter solute-binding subunit [Peribacillus sp. TH16]|uniref:TAXI family TRAP transporter solute-binding subunit n=1 Tax=unclassified Peribacillus TaxID=2675266 RepID=UPI0019130E3E|nr:MULTISPECIES: TAXI family TRAP transporter solute-binding subunit [unclassified Peribacillus]MBK5458724.1 TAXI family TRAP transporter solute-binding subunit [Peribacillus sp. TH27]MBK5480632.1 TAXI family TRAP transporter solute-binding subunit [Peribacillus sp. TH16]WMX57884.1 TAXI family TRAP transporter solute-binding subunit [Peribacillus sp. R9-11]